MAKNYEALYSKHNEKLEKVKKLIVDKEIKEVEECTFTP